MLLEIALALYILLAVIICVLHNPIGQHIARRMYKVRMSRLIHARETAWLRPPGLNAKEWDWQFSIQGESRERLFADDGRNRIDAV